MLLFISGAARTGKGILVRRLLIEERLPFLSLDVLKMGVARGLPECAFDPDVGGIEVANYLWPLVREMTYNLLAVCPNTGSGNRICAGKAQEPMTCDKP